MHEYKLLFGNDNMLIYLHHMDIYLGNGYDLNLIRRCCVLFNSYIKIYVFDISVNIKGFR